MDFLIRHAVPVRSDFNGPIRANTHYVAITFDDALQSFYENALPELKKRSIPFTIFAPTSCLGNKPSWVNKSTEMPYCEVVLKEDLLKQLDRDVFTSIESHTHTHPMLAKVSREDVWCELKTSKAFLSHLLQRDVTQLSFPFGSFDKEIIKLAKKAGYKRVFGILPTLRKFKYNDFFVGRVKCKPNYLLADFRFRVEGSYQWMPYAVLIKRCFFEFCRSKLRFNFLFKDGGISN